MRPSPVSSFLKFTIGFLIFVSISFGVTVVVNSITAKQQQQQQTAAAIQAMLQPEK